METTTIKQLNNNIRQYEKNDPIEDFDINQEVNLIGWVRSCRDSGKVIFISFNDGSRLNSIQLVSKEGHTQGHEELKGIRFGSSILVTGKPILTLDNQQQKFEIFLSRVKVLKVADEDFPIQKKEHSMEFLREVAHIRPKTNTFYAVMKLRSELSFAIHNFFHLNNFVWLSSPIITSNDAEGAGETFKVVDASDDNAFFGGVNATLAVSGQLHAEAYAQTFKRVYTFGPTFRAEKSHTSRHISEFWMVEPEIAFCELNQLIFLIESFIKFLIKIILKKCYEEIGFIEKNIDPTITSRLNGLLNSDFTKIEYRTAIEILTRSIADNTSNFEDKQIYFGKDLKSEHERYLCEIWNNNNPLFIYNYPKQIKAFYMKENKDNTTVAACDLLFPGVGEVVGGSQREEDYQKLIRKCQELNISTTDIEWYLDLRKYGYYKSSGFGLGFERLIQYITGMENIKDAIPFPRSHGVLKF
ncbi:MAG: asparagine--tRNA ligase [Mycoplasmoidaceae bacterium]